MKLKFPELSNWFHCCGLWRRTKRISIKVFVKAADCASYFLAKVDAIIWPTVCERSCPTFSHFALLTPLQNFQKWWCLPLLKNVEYLILLQGFFYTINVRWFFSRQFLLSLWSHLSLWPFWPFEINRPRKWVMFGYYAFLNPFAKFPKMANRSFFKPFFKERI